MALKRKNIVVEFEYIDRKIKVQQLTGVRQVTLEKEMSEWYKKVEKFETLTKEQRIEVYKKFAQIVVDFTDFDSIDDIFDENDENNGLSINEMMALVNIITTGGSDPKVTIQRTL